MESSQSFIIRPSQKNRGVAEKARENYIFLNYKRLTFIGIFDKI